MKSKIEQISELGARMSDKSNIEVCIVRLFKLFEVGKILKRSSMEKQKGFSVYELLTMMCLFRINKESIHRWFRKGFCSLFDGEKNCFYRLLCSPKMNWRALLLGMGLQFDKIVAEKTINNESSQENKRPRCLIIDDSFLAKVGECIELIGRVYDHVTKKHLLGYKLLALAFFDGISSIIIDFSIHYEAGKNQNRGMSKQALNKQFTKKRSAGAVNKTRYDEAGKTKIEVAIEMIQRAIEKINVDYVLMDSWFTCDELIKSIRAIKGKCIHLIGLCKMGNTKYQINGKDKSIKAIIAANERKNLKKCRKYKCAYFSVKVNFKDTPVKLFFIKYGDSKDFTLLLSTETEISFIKAFEIYQIRWNIEILFKENKQYFGLGNCQSRDFDAQIADATLCFITHCILTLEKRFSDYETLGELFREQQKNLYQITLWPRILSMLMIILEKLVNIMNRSFDEVMELIYRDNEFGRDFHILSDLFEKDNPKPEAA